MKKIMATVILSVVLVMSLASVAFGATGREYGAFHSGEAIENHGFTGTSNPGLNHTGFSGYNM